MDNEIRLSRWIGFIFLIPCSAIAGFLLYKAPTQSGNLSLSALFALGAVVGIIVLAFPRTLVRVSDGNLELFQALLCNNDRLVVIPIEDIRDFEIRNVDMGEGSSSILTLHLTKPQRLNERAMAIIACLERSPELLDGDEWTLHWDLCQPAGGIAKAEQRLRELMSPHMQ